MREKKTDNQISGIELQPPQLMAKAPSAEAEFFLDAVLVLLALSGSVWCQISAFSLPALPLDVFLFTFFATGVFLAAFHFRRAQNYILVASALIYLYLLYYLRVSLVQGLLIIANQIFSVWSDNSNLTLPAYVISVEPAQYPALCTAAVFSLIVPGAVLFSFAIFKKSFLITFLFSFPFLFLALVFQTIPALPAVLALAVCWAVLLLVRPAARKKRFSRKHVMLRGRSAAATKIGFLMLAVVTVCFLLIYRIFPKENYNPPVQAETIRSGMISSLSSLAPLFKTGTAISGLATQVNLKNAGSVRFFGETMLQVWMSDPHSAYLKGYTGSVYTGQSWKQLPDDQFEAVNTKLHGINVQNMLQAYLSLFPGKSDGAVSQFEIRVKNVAAGRQLIYAPYNLSTTPENISGVQFVNDSRISSDNLFGTSQYNLFAYLLKDRRFDFSPKGMFLSTLSDTPFSVEFKAKVEANGTLGTYLQQQDRFQTLNQRNIEAYYKNTLPSGLLNLLGHDEQNFVTAEQDYRLFMYDPYTDLPKDVREDMRAFLEQEGLLKNYRSVNDMVAAVQAYLRHGYTYTLTPGSVPKGRDFAEYFLRDNKKGYCVHFATAATVMLRAMGVPARYAEGFIVTSDDYKNASDGWADVKDSRAHAWVEVYEPGLGWQPVEVTSGFQLTNNGLRDLNAANTDAPLSSPVSSATAASTAMPKTAPTAPQNLPALPKMNVWDMAIFFLLLIAAFLLFLFIRRKIALSMRSKLFSDQDVNQAVLSIYGYCLRLQKYGGEIGADITEIAEKARFSRSCVSVEEREKCRDYAKSLAKQTYASLIKHKKLLLKFKDNLL